MKTLTLAFMAALSLTSFAQAAIIDQTTNHLTFAKVSTYRSNPADDMSCYDTHVTILIDKTAYDNAAGFGTSHSIVASIYFDGRPAWGPNFIAFHTYDKSQVQATAVTRKDGSAAELVTLPGFDTFCWGGDMSSSENTSVLLRPFAYYNGADGNTYRTFEQKSSDYLEKFSTYDFDNTASLLQ